MVLVLPVLHQAWGDCKPKLRKRVSAISVLTHSSIIFLGLANLKLLELSLWKPNPCLIVQQIIGPRILVTRTRVFWSIGFLHSTARGATICIDQWNIHLIVRRDPSITLDRKERSLHNNKGPMASKAYHAPWTTMSQYILHKWRYAWNRVLLSCCKWYSIKWVSYNACNTLKKVATHILHYRWEASHNLLHIF